MRILFTITLFLSSALLFLIQPMIAKMILPRFGGSPGVWNTSMVFFQAALLIGYGYAHLATKWLGARRQSLVHIGVLALAVISLPIAIPAASIWREGSGGSWEVLFVLAFAVGTPFTVISAGAPLLQRWFAGTGDKHAHDPYFLYSASNLGSMLALLAYPFLVEPNLRLREQTLLWTYSFYGLVALVALCALALWRSKGAAEPIHDSPTLLPPEAEDATAQPAGKHERLRWVALAFIPSSLLLEVTTFLTSNIAPVPLLWVVPLALYLLTFILAFAKKPLVSTRILGRILPLVVTPLALMIVLEASQFMVLFSSFHLLAFVIIGWLCHGELANSRPKADRLTEFYFYVSLGGVLGGIFNALVAPALFNSLFEYPLVIALACCFRPRKQGDSATNQLDLIYVAWVALFTASIMLYCRASMAPSQVRTALAIGVPLILTFFAVDRPVRYGMSLLAVFVLAGVTQIAVNGTIVEAHRSFYGIHRVETSRNQYGVFHSLMHGNTLHGRENFDGPYVGIPLTYYHSTGPIGDVFQKLGPSRKNVALVGLGIGSLAAYGQPGQVFTFYELDPDVARIARDPKLFTFLQKCKADLRIEIGDARLTLKRTPDAAIDLLVLDAFSSDSIPVHLLTREAFQMYLSKLSPGGVIALHISNRYLDLRPVVANVAASLSLRAKYFEDEEQYTLWGKYPSKWVILARDAKDFGPLEKSLLWDRMEPDPKAPLWTDDYSNLIQAFKKDED